MKIIVFGGSGFLGSHVADELTEIGHDVTIFDLKKSPYLRSNQKIILGDITDEGKVRKTMQNQEVVYNFAGLMSIDDCIKYPIEAIKNNILGNGIILEVAKEEKIKRFIFASSTYVYSNSGAHYRTTKQACELFIEDYWKLYGLPYTILRYGSLYGDRAKEHNSIYKLLKNALVYGKIDYEGSGDEIREFIHVKDAAILSVKVLDPEFENQHIVLTGNQAMRYRELLHMINELLGGKVKINYLPKRDDAHYEITSYSFNPRLGRKLVNNPHIDMGQGLIACLTEIYQEKTKI